ncbi:MAG: ABC transporter permease [Gemmatimonadota bacterium]
MTAPTRPPRWARAVLSFLVPESGREAIGDLDEEYEAFVLPERGRAAANRWYVGQVVRSAPTYIRARLQQLGASHADVILDVRFALRILRRRTGFSVAMVATLALALGVATSIYSVAHAVLLAPLPMHEPNRVVRPLPDELFFLGAGEIEPFAERMTTLESFAAWGRTLFLFESEADAEEVRGARVSWTHFDVLGAAPMLGRGFVRDDAASDAAIILSHGLWTRRFGGEEGVVGSTIDLFGEEVTVVGVMPPGHVPIEHDWEAWRPIPLDLERVAQSGFAGQGRLAAGASLADARAELRRVLPELWEEGGYVSPPQEREGLEVQALDEWLIGDAGQVLRTLLAAAGLVLLLACVNVSNLVLAQSRRRRGEFAIRTALGGSRGRLMRLRAIELLVLCALGGMVALGAAALSMNGLGALLPAELPRASQIRLSGPVLLFTGVATLLSAVLVGTLPTVGEGRARVALKSGGRNRLRAALVTGQMALAVLLVVGAGLMLRTLQSLRSVDTGFTAAQVVTVRPSPPSDRYPDDQALRDYYGRISAEVERLPSVSAVGGIQFLPMTPGGWWSRYRPEGLVVPDGENEPRTAMRVVTGEYFDAMQIRLLGGRTLEESDGAAGAEPVVVVNETLARDAFAQEDAVGRTVHLGDTSARIVGVVADVRQSDVRTQAHPEMYIPFGARPWRRMHIVAHVASADAVSLREVADAVRGVDPTVALLGPRSMTEIVGTTFGSTRLLTVLLTVFGIVGLGLGAVGVYAVTAQSVEERRRDIGIRVALGAARSGVAAQTILTSMVPVVAGLVIGWGLAVFGTRWIEGLLFDVAPLDVPTFAVAPLVLVAVATLATIVPAVSASRVDPVRSLQEQ